MTGSLQEKNGKWNMVLYGEAYMLNPDKPTDDPHKKIHKWLSTGYDATGRNKSAATKMMYETIQRYENEAEKNTEKTPPDFSEGNRVLFTDYISEWLTRKKNEIRLITLEGYQVYAERHIIPYFSNLKLTLAELRPKHFLDYYQFKATGGRLDRKAGGLGTRSLRSHAQLIKAVLNDAVILEYIPRNPALNVPVPKKPRTETAAKNVYMTAEEADKMLSAISGEDVYPKVYTALYYGLRKSEVLGLKWNAVDFDNNTLEIRSTVVKHKTIVYMDDTKTENSHNTFSLLPEVKELLLSVKEKQAANEAEYGILYSPSEYIFTHPDGRLFRPDCLTKTFQRTLKRHELPEMRFHDLRHSTASILFDKGWDIEMIKSWLRHADIETTSNIYLHISKQRKTILAGDMEGTFSPPHIDQSCEEQKNAAPKGDEFP